MNGGASFIAVAAVVAAAGGAVAQEAGTNPHPHAGRPLAIPQQFAPPQEAYASFPDRAAGPAGSSAAAPSACQTRLASLAEFKPLPVLVGAGECGADDAVLMQSVVLPDQSRVAVSPPATMRCTMAEAVALWLREDIVPVVRSMGSPLRTVEEYDSYECRGRNRVRGAMLSEHGRANALDIRALVLADGRSVGLTDVNVTKEWRTAIRASACARFSTVLGPGSDGFHEEHIHLDLAERHGGYKTCEWDVRSPAPPAARTEQGAAIAAASADTVPLPRPRPQR